MSNSFKGTCVSRALSDDYNCICNPSFSGKNCQFIISHRNASNLNDASPKREPLVPPTTLEINFVASRNTTSPLKPAKAFFSNGFPGTARTKTICDHESPCLNGGNGPSIKCKVYDIGFSYKSIDYE